MSDETTPGPAKKHIEALAFNAVSKVLTADDTFVRLSVRAEIAQAVLAVVQPELDRLTERIPYRQGETEEQYLERQIARWRSEAWQARGKLKAAEKCAETAEAKRDVLAEILVTQVQLHRDHHPNLGKRVCQTCGTFRELVETEAFKAAEARLFGALLHAIETGNYVACPAPEDQSEDLDRDHDDLPAVREFFANLDPREETG